MGELDVLGIGNAIVDILAEADDATVDALGLPKGGMTLVDAERSKEILAVLGRPVRVSGGSAANTVAGAASLGSSAAFIGKIRNDALGADFAADIAASGVGFATRPLDGPPDTARCTVLVTPDGERTLSTYLGACTRLGPGDIDPELVRRARVTYLEGYLFDQPHSGEALRTAASLAHRAGRQVAVTLSDTLCIDRHRQEFLDLVDGAADLVFGNEEELRTLCGTQDLSGALERVCAGGAVAAVTRGAKGSVVASERGFEEVPAEPGVAVVDTTGAGDAYAAGFLHGLVRGAGLARCARLGSLAAGEVISHLGARPGPGLAARADPLLADG